MYLEVNELRPYNLTTWSKKINRLVVDKRKRGEFKNESTKNQ
jgi:hypothetical protein